MEKLPNRIEAGNVPASIRVEKIFQDGGDKRVFEGDHERKLVVEKIDADTLRITESGIRYIKRESPDDAYNKRYTRTEHVLPIYIVEQEIPERIGNPGVVTVKDGWAYPRPLYRDDLETYKAHLSELINAPAFPVGSPELVQEDRAIEPIYYGVTYMRHDQNDPEPKKGAKERFEGGTWKVEGTWPIGHWGDGAHFSTVAEAQERAQVLAEEAKNLDVPLVESMIGTLTPREVHMLKTIAGVEGSYSRDSDINELLSNIFWVNKDENPIERMKGYARSADSLEKAPPKSYTNDDWQAEAEDMKALAAKAILSRLDK